MSTHSLRWQTAAIARSVTNLRAFIERRNADPRWPKSDIDTQRQHLASLEAAFLTMRRLHEREDDPRFSALIKEIVE